MHSCAGGAENLILTFSLDVNLCHSFSPSTAPARGAGGAEAGTDGLGTPAGHSPSTRRDLQAEILCAVQEVMLGMKLGMKLQSSALAQPAVGPEGLNSTFLIAPAPLGSR